MRNEIKFEIYKGQTNILINSLLINQLKEIYTKRKVNSLYYDTENLNLYNDTVNGLVDRKKIRARFYNMGEDGYKIEQKIKKDHLNRKEYLDSKQIKDIYLEEGITKTIESRELIYNKLKLPSRIKNYYYPKTLVSYDRRYFITACQKYRITIDYNIIFRKALSSYNRIILLNKRILEKNIFEIKYESYVDDISDNLRTIICDNGFLYTKSSKYAKSIECIY